MFNFVYVRLHHACYRLSCREDFIIFSTIFKKKTLSSKLNRTSDWFPNIFN